MGGDAGAFIAIISRYARPPGSGACPRLWWASMCHRRQSHQHMVAAPKHTHTKEKRVTKGDMHGNAIDSHMHLFFLVHGVATHLKGRSGSW